MMAKCSVTRVAYTGSASDTILTEEEAEELMSEDGKKSSDWDLGGDRNWG